MSLVIFQYFLDASGNFENLVKIWTRSPPNYHQNASNNARKYGIILDKYYFCQSGTHTLLDFFENVCPRYQMFSFLFSVVFICF